MRTVRQFAAFPFILLLLVAYMAAVFLGLLVDAVAGENHSTHLFNW